MDGKPFGPEIELWAGGAVVIGTDEAGRGPLAGPVVAAAVAFPADVFIPGVDDSKKLSPKRRERASRDIRKRALAYAIAEIDSARIDEINILAATREAMESAVRQVAATLGSEWPVALVDGRIPDLGVGKQINIIRGDAISFSIGAASILAKVHRDGLMTEFDRKYPDYGFADHKGYPTARHRNAVLRHGPCPIHRLSFHIHRSGGERLAIGDLIADEYSPGIGS